MTQLAALFNNFTLSWDLGVIIFLFIAVFMYGFSVGQRKIGLLLLSIYFAYVITDILPNSSRITDLMPSSFLSFFDVGVFVALVFVLFFVLAGSVLRSTLGLPRKEEGQWWHLCILSFVIAGFFSSSILALAPDLYYDQLSTITSEFFLENFAQFGWAIAGILTLVFLKRTKKKA